MGIRDQESGIRDQNACPEAILKTQKKRPESGVPLSGL